MNNQELHNAHVIIFARRQLYGLYESMRYLVLKPEYGGYAGEDWHEKYDALVVLMDKNEERLMEGRE